jgi:reticulon-3
MADSLAAETSVTKARPFGRTKSVRELLGDGKVADILLWKEWKTSLAIAASVTLLWFAFEISSFTLVTLIADLLMVAISVTFVWAQVASFLNKPGPPLPELKLSEDTVKSGALLLRDEVNKILQLSHDVALGKDYLLFAKVVGALYVISVIGGWFNFLTLIFLAIAAAFSLPLLYDKNEDFVDAHLGKGLAELEKVYKKVEDQVLTLLNRKQKKTD